MSTERKAEILGVAKRVFAEHGYAKTTMDSIAETAGFTKPILYNYFSGKGEIYTEIVTNCAAQLLHALSRATTDASTPRARVEAAVGVYFDMLVRETTTFRILFLQSQRSEMAGELRGVELLLTSFIEEQISIDLDASHRRQLAAAVVGMAEGAAISWLILQETLNWPTPPDDEAQRLARRLATLAWGGLRSVRQD